MTLATPAPIGMDHARTLHAVAFVAASIAMVIGVATLVAWHSQGDWLWTTVRSATVRYNTGLGFIIGSAGLIAASLDKSRYALAAGAIVLAVGGLTVLEHLTGANLGIDEFLLKDYTASSNLLPGRMPIRSALALAGIGIVLMLLAARGRGGLSRIVAAELFSFIVLAIALSGVAGVLAEFGDGSALGYSVPPRAGALMSIAALLALGIGFIALIWQHQNVRVGGMPRWIPLLLCFVVLLLDLASPPTLTAGIAYIPIIFCSLWFAQPYTAFVFAALTTALTVLGYFESRSDDIEFWTAISNRALTIGALWFVASLVYINRRSEGAFQQSDTRLRAVVADHALDGLITINEQGLVEYFNPACERIFGYRAAEVAGHNIKMLMPEPYHGEHDGYLAHYLKTGEAHIIGTAGREVTARRKDGSVFPMDLSISAVHLEDGRHFFGIVRDVTERKEVERQIKEESARTLAIMNTVLDGIVTIDERGTVQAFNPSAVRIFGYEPDEVIGKNVNMLMPEPYHREHDGYLNNYLTTGEAKIIGIGREVSGRRKDGSEFPMALGISEVQVAGVRTFVGTVRDITERTRAEEIKWRLAAVFETSGDAIITETLDGVIASWSAGAERIFGYSADESIGQTINLLIPKDRQAEEVHILTEVTNNRRIHHFETVRLAKDGRGIDVSLSVSPISDAAGRVIGATKIARDITGRIETEKMLQRYTRDLERSNQELDDFAHIASHDLKEPLRGLFNHATFLLEDYRDKLDAEGLRRLNRLGQLCQRMEQLINDLMYFSRLGRAEIAKKETDINAVIVDIQKTMDEFIVERHARIDVPHPLPTVLCDPVRTAEVFRNLITNSVKYRGTENPRVEIGFLDSVDVGSGVERDVFYVRDNGLGIEPEFHQEIFRIFRRLQKSSGDGEAGTGVGLTFVKKIVERQGGRVWLDSALGQGTTFYFTLSGHQGTPATDAAEKDSHETAPAAADLAG